MPIRMKDLGPKARAQVEAALDAEPTRKRNRREVGADSPCAQRCECGQETADWPEMERHMQAAGHRRSSIDLTRETNGNDRVRRSVDGRGQLRGDRPRPVLP